MLSLSLLTGSVTNLPGVLKRRVNESMNSTAQTILNELMAGNARFCAGTSTGHQYSPQALATLATSQAPQAAVIGCCDSRVGPEAVLDQPLGSLFVSRTPGNVASDGAKWMLEIAIEEMHVPLVIVMGHTECLAVGQVLNGQLSGPGGSQRWGISRAVSQAKYKTADDLYRQSVIENAIQTASVLKSESWNLHRALLNGTTSIVAAIYDVHTGRVEILDGA
jgi:carbonic anhydrase